MNQWINELMKENEWMTDRETDRRVVKKRDMVDKWTDWETGRQADREIDRQTDR